MQKIPVFQTVGHAYGFAFGRYLSTLGIIWLPYLLLAVLAYFLLLPAIGPMMSALGQIIAHPQDTAGNAAVIQQMNRSNAYIQLYDLLALAVGVIVISGITKEALGIRTGPRFFYLQFGSAELCVLVAMILMVVIIIGVVFAAIFGGVLIGVVGIMAAGSAGSGTGATAAQGLIGLIVGLGVFAAAFYILARSLFLLVPASVAENSIAIGRSWTLAQGNIWRIFAMTLLTIVPVVVLNWIVLAAFAIPFILRLAADQKAGGQAAVQHDLATMFQSLPQYVIGFYLVAFLVAPVIYGLFVSMPVFAYRALVPAGTPKDAASHF